LIKEVTRDRVKVPSVEFEKIEDNLGYITINIFGDETSRDFEEAIYNLRETD
jgi:C-terminal processing protease CtpA/Prc